MKIGEVAVQSGVSAKMVRYYESIGLIPAAKRSTKGYRGYDTTDVHTLKFIRRCRDLGFNMGEISNLLALWQNRKRKSAEVKRLAGLHVKELQTKIDALQSMVNTLSQLVQCCHGDDRPECPILEELEGTEQVEAKVPRLC